MTQRSPRRARPPRWASAALWAMILVYAAYFSIVSIRLHEAQRTHTADLGQIDLAIWNTSQGRFVQEIKGEQISTRLTDHVEPIFAPVSLVFWLWNDVRALLVLQSVVLALAAWPVFQVAYGRLGRNKQVGKSANQQVGPPAATAKQSQPTVAQENGRTDEALPDLPDPELAKPVRRLSDQNGLALAALAFALAYLLYPPLQAANVAEFHALPLATPLILLAFLFVERRQWLRFAIAALLVATVQEGTALLTAMLGAYALALGIWRIADGRRKASREAKPVSRISNSASSIQHPVSRFPFHVSASPLLTGGLVLVAGLAWFYVATFVIIPTHAAQAYGLTETPYAARFGALGDSFGDVVRSLLTRPGLVLGVALEPLRVQYMLKLLAPVGFLALAGPEILLLALPLFLANLLSGFPFQYSGQLHYSAPLAAYVLVAAIIGANRIRKLVRRMLAALPRPGWVRAHRAYAPMIAWLLAWSLGCQVAWGYTPFGTQFRFYWPQVTAHDRLLQRFVEQIPADAALSTMPTLHPHLSHREQIYTFPTLAASQFVLLDMAARSGWSRHPAEVRQQVDEMLRSGQWAVQDAADGYLLLRRSDGAAAQPASPLLPTDFYSFARPNADPQHPLDVTFSGPNGAQVKLVGYDLLDDPQWRRTAFRFYWQALTPLPEGLNLRAFFVTPDGQEVDSTDQRPLIQPLWQPPNAWPVGETVVTDKLHWYLPRQWAPAVGVYQGDSWDAVDRRWKATAVDTPTFDGGTWVQLPPVERRNGKLSTFSPPLLAAPRVASEGSPLTDGLPSEPAAGVTFGGDGWTVNLTGVYEPPRTSPRLSSESQEHAGGVPLVLRWRADGPSPRDYTIFVHLRDKSGRTVAQADASPTWFGVQPTTQWPGGDVLSAHALQIPPNLPPGVYDLAVGWYYWETQERLALLGPDGLPAGDTAVIGQLEVDATAAPRPDLTCALVPEACSSLD